MQPHYLNEDHYLISCSLRGQPPSPYNPVSSDKKVFVCPSNPGLCYQVMDLSGEKCTKTKT